MGSIKSSDRDSLALWQPGNRERNTGSRLPTGSKPAVASPVTSRARGRSLLTRVDRFDRRQLGGRREHHQVPIRRRQAPESNLAVRERRQLASEEIGRRAVELRELVVVD